MESDLVKLILEIEGTKPQTIAEKPDDEFFELWLDPTLTENLAGNIGAFFIRALLNKLNINEHHVLKWRLENKYVQYQVLNHYSPGCMAQTLSLSGLLHQTDGIHEINTLCENGFFVKATLGDSSGRLHAYDRTSELELIVNSYTDETNNLEKWVLQKRLALYNEFRVHSFGMDIIDGLTFIIKSTNTDNSGNCEAFVKEVIQKLPETIVNGSLIAWDVGLTTSNEYYIIEANFTGYHQEYCPGFQTSGYFGDKKYGPIVCAWINNYCRNKYHVSINCVEPGLLDSHEFCREFMMYKSIFNDAHIELIRNTKSGVKLCGLIYLGTPFDFILIQLLKYFQLEGFATEYYVITKEVKDPILNDVVLGENIVYIINENILFSDERYTEILNLDYEDRKVLCCEKATHLIKKECFVLA